jgi:hypothetical protein
VARNVAITLNQVERSEPNWELTEDKDVAATFDRLLPELERSATLIQDNLIKPTANLLDMVGCPNILPAYI